MESDQGWKNKVFKKKFLGFSFFNSLGFNVRRPDTKLWQEIREEYLK